MSAPVRFLAVAVFGWITVRAAGQVLMLDPLPPIPLPQPETPLLASNEMAEPAPLPEVAQPPMQPFAPPMYPAAYPGTAAPYAQPWMPRPYPVPVYYPTGPVAAYPASYPQAPRSTPAWLPEGPGPDFVDMPQTDEAPQPQLALVPTDIGIRPRPLPSFVGGKPAGPPRLDRLSLSGWALIRQPTNVVIDPRNPVTEPAGLAPGGQLGGSQAGARLTYRFTRGLAANLRVSAPYNPQTQTRLAGEAALGVSWQPLSNIPVRVMAERRQSWGGPAGGGRNAFALLAEGGVYGQRLPWNFKLDGYGQVGVVSLRDRAWFVDGGATVSRPLFGRFALGAGAWGGAQQGLARLDVGPRLSMQLYPGVRTHLDYRHRLVGQAQPGSGWAVTVGADF